MPTPEAPNDHQVFLPVINSSSDAAGGRPRRTPQPSPTPKGSPTPTSSPTPRPSPTPEKSPTPTSVAGFRPSIVVDLQRCIGCNACSLACKQQNNVQIGEKWNEVYGVENGLYPVAKTRTLPMFCQHCADAPCKQKCDSLGYHAIQQRSDGIVYIQADLCTGCQECIRVCHYKSISFNVQTQKAEKCNLCMERIDAGLAPACVITCVGITREYGDFNALRAKYPRAKTMGDNLQVLYVNMGGEPSPGTDSIPTNGYPSPIECHD